MAIQVEKVIKKWNTIKEIIKANNAFVKAFATKGQKGDESQWGECSLYQE